MTPASITVEVLKGAIPAACFSAGQQIEAVIALIVGLESLRMTVEEITEGTGDTDTVILSYDADLIPVGAALAQCNLSSFQCLCDCCAEKRCFEVVAPTSDVIEVTDLFGGYFPGNFQCDEVRVYPATRTDTSLVLTALIDGETLFSNQVIEQDVTTIPRATFLEPFSVYGIFTEDSKLTLNVVDAPTGDLAWQGLTLCFIGRWTAASVES